jgi:hypothetical protein
MIHPQVRWVWLLFPLLFPRTLLLEEVYCKMSEMVKDLLFGYTHCVLESDNDMSLYPDSRPEQITILKPGVQFCMEQCVLLEVSQ